MDIAISLSQTGAIALFASLAVIVALSIFAVMGAYLYRYGADGSGFHYRLRKRRAARRRRHAEFVSRLHR